MPRTRRIAALLVASALCVAGCDAGDSRVAGLWRAAAPWLGLATAPEAEEPPRAAAARAPAADPTPAAPVAPTTAPAPEEPGGYWRYTEANGSLRFVESLAEVPESARASAQRVAAAAPRTAPPPAARRAAPRRPAPARAAPPDATRRTEAGSVVVYTTSWCGWCRKTLAWLDARGVDYENRDIERDPRWAAELQRKTGSQAIPVVDVDGQLVRGFDPGTLERLL